MSHQAPSGPGRRILRSSSSSSAPAASPHPAPTPVGPAYPPPEHAPPPAQPAYAPGAYPPAPPAAYPPPPGYAAPASPAYNPYAPPPEAPLRAWGSAPPPSTPLLGRREVLALVALGVVLVLTAVFAVQRITTAPRAPGDSRDARRIPELAGYGVFGGPHGKAFEAGAPWGFACAPVLFRLDTSMPPVAVAQFAGVVRTAAEQGLNMAVVVGDADPTPGTLTGDSSSWRVVHIGYTEGPAALNDEGRPTSLGSDYSGRLTPDGRWEDLVFYNMVVYGRTVGDDPVLLRRAARLAVAHATGLAGARSTSSGITRSMLSEVDLLTRDDLAALHAMSGCPVPPTR